MLALHPAFHYVHELFNPDWGKSAEEFGLGVKYYFTYVGEKNGTAFVKPVKRMLENRFDLIHGLTRIRSVQDFNGLLRKRRTYARRRKSGSIPILKDPIALMSAEWLASRFGVRPVVLIRHPAACVSSMKRLNWVSHPESWALSQPLLMRDYLGPFKNQIEKLRIGEHDVIERASLAWKMHHHVILQYMEKHKDWIFLRHEDLSMDPVDGFTNLYKRLGILITDKIKQEIEGFSGVSNPSRAKGNEITIHLNSRENITSWKYRLSVDEVARIREYVGEIADEFYSDDEWDIDNSLDAAQV
jgi:hypothetical protein